MFDEYTSGQPTATPKGEAAPRTGLSLGRLVLEVTAPLAVVAVCWILVGKFILEYPKTPAKPPIRRRRKK